MRTLEPPKPLRRIPTTPETTTSTSSNPPPPHHHLDPVIKIYATHSTPNFLQPWQKHPQTHSTSTGFILPNRTIITNAHAVLHATVVHVKRRGDDTRYIARVCALAEECDLAQLSVSAEGGGAFWQGMGAFELGGLVAPQSHVSVVGYPLGGDGVAVTTGVVSRVELRRYVVGGGALLALQTSAPINHGNSGGPALDQGGVVVGVAFQMVRGGGTENIGYLIAADVVRQFLNHCRRHGRFTGFCHPGFQWQAMENAAIRTAMSMREGQTGILVREVAKVGGAAAVLKVGDIITAVNDVCVSNVGTVPFRFGDRIDFHYALMCMFPGDQLKVHVIRGRKEKVVRYALAASSDHFVVPVKEECMSPQYLTIAGFVFVVLSLPYIDDEIGAMGGEGTVPSSFLDLLGSGWKEYHDHQIVILSQVLSAEINVGYEDVAQSRLFKFNGTRIRNLNHLAHMVDQCRDEFMTFDLDFNVVVLATNDAIQSSPAILQTHGISKPYSLDGPSGSAAKYTGNLARMHVLA